MQVHDEKNPHVVTIGLFGTCGGSKWRDSFKSTYESMGIMYFDPQVDDWKPELAVIEADHLASDEIVLIPVTSETYGSGSLAEVGFTVFQAAHSDQRRDFVIMIDPDLDDSLDNEVARKESLRTRKLVLAHLAKVHLNNVFVVDNLDDMLEVSLMLYESAIAFKGTSRFRTNNR